MKIERLNDKIVAIGPLDLLGCELLEQIRASAEPGDSVAARARLFPRPSTDRKSEFHKDWKEYVEPELAQLFASNLDIIEDDLKRLATSGSDGSGRTLYEHHGDRGREVVNPSLAYLVTHMLSDDDARSDTFGRNGPLALGRSSAGKTGTTDDYRDSWVVGYTPDLLTGVCRKQRRLADA